MLQVRNPDRVAVECTHAVELTDVSIFNLSESRVQPDALVVPNVKADTLQDPALPYEHLQDSGNVDSRNHTAPAVDNVR